MKYRAFCPQILLITAFLLSMMGLQGYPKAVTRSGPRIERPCTISVFKDRKRLAIKPLLVNKQAFVTEKDVLAIWGAVPDAPRLRIDGKSYFNLKETATLFEYLVEWVPARKRLYLVRTLLDPRAFSVALDSKDPNQALLLLQGRTVAAVQGDPAGISAVERATLIASRLNGMELPQLTLEDVQVMRKQGIYEVWIFGERKLPLDGDDDVRRYKEKEY